MNLSASKVIHSKYGEGTIINQDASSVSVKFATEGEIKKFIYPTCFKTFLKLVDAKDASAAEDAISEHEKAAHVRKEKERCESEQRAFEQRLQNKPSARSGKSIALRPFRSIDAFCEQYEKALSTEISYLRKNGGKRQRIFNGKLIESKNNHYIYSFEADSELNYPDLTQITLWRGMNSSLASIVACEDFTIIIETLNNFGTDIDLIEFSAEPWKLIKTLIERLNQIRQLPHSPIVQELICNGRKKIQYGKKIIKGQNNACHLAQSQPITFVWGPPGTGKTETLAKIALAHIKQKNRVLMLSYSNVSVDGAILRVHKFDKEHRAGKLIRYGYARNKDLLHHEYLTAYNLAIHNHPALLEERTKLLAERKRTSRTSMRYVQIEKRLTKIRTLLLDEEKGAVRSALFVATTVSKAVVDKTVYEDQYDVVVFDEASMAYIPQIIFAANLATKHFICMGDFDQLPPIVQSSSDSILNADVFQYCGITDAVDTNHSHEWLCLLNTQYRMHPRIADFASVNMYHSLLKSEDSMEKKQYATAHSAPFIDQPLGLADLSGMMSVCTKTADYSRVNPLSALIAFGLALQAADRFDIGVISPYTAQSRLLHAMARDFAEQYPKLHQISCATVHQFQGSEKDVIIYDAVDCYRQRFPGKLLTSTNNNYANRLFNVALTRARGKFIAVANISYMQNKNLSSNLMFAKLLKQIKYSRQSIQGGQFKAALGENTKNIFQWMNEQNGNELFNRDLSTAQKEIRIDIPSKMGCEEKISSTISDMIQQAKARGVKVVIRAEFKKLLPEKIRHLVIENKYVANPVTLIDKQIVWFGQPLSDAHFISQGTVLPTNYRPIIRFVGKHTASSLYGFLEMNRMIDQSTNISTSTGEDDVETFASYVAKHKTCSKCGKPMKLIKNKGKFFLGCSGYPNCQNTEFVEVGLVEKYFYSKSKSGKHCPKDHTSLEAKLGPYGVYVQCCSLARHRYNLDEI